MPENRSRCPGPASSSSDHLFWGLPRLLLQMALVAARPPACSGGSFAGAESRLQQLRVSDLRGFARLYRQRQFGSAKLKTFESKLPNLQPISPVHACWLGCTAPAQLAPARSSNSCPSLRLSTSPSEAPALSVSRLSSTTSAGSAPSPSQQRTRAVPTPALHAHSFSSFSW